MSFGHKLPVPARVPYFTNIDGHFRRIAAQARLDVAFVSVGPLAQEVGDAVPVLPAQVSPAQQCN